MYLPCIYYVGTCISLKCEFCGYMYPPYMCTSWEHVAALHMHYVVTRISLTHEQRGYMYQP